MAKKPHPSRQFILASTVRAALVNAGCVQLPRSKMGLTFWQSPRGRVFTLMDPTHEIGGKDAYDLNYLRSFQNNLVRIMRGHTTENSPSEPQVTANCTTKKPKKRH